MDNKLPEVSVIISTCNRAGLLGRAVRSVLAQSYTDYELIIVDDASIDGTEEVVRSFTDSRIVLARHGERKGGSAARNTGIKMAKGKYVAFLDDDDEWMADKLEKQVEKIKRSPDDVGVIYTGVELVGPEEDHAMRTIRPVLRGNLKDSLLRGSTIGTVSRVLARKECFEKAGLFDESLKSSQDWDMWLRIADHYSFDLVPEPLVRIHLHGKRISTDPASVISGRTRLIEKHMGRLSRYPDIMAIHFKRLGKLNCINGYWRKGMSWFGKALKVSPMEIVKIAAWCVFELPGYRLRRRRVKK